MSVRRVDTAGGPIIISAGTRNCTIETMARMTLLRGRRELDEVIHALMDIRERFIEGPRAAIEGKGEA